jgi:hypothetical protein
VGPVTFGGFSRESAYARFTIGVDSMMPTSCIIAGDCVWETKAVLGKRAEYRGADTQR